MELNLKENALRVVSGMSMGIIISLVPQAIAGQLAIALQLKELAALLTFSTSLLCFAIGIGVALEFKLDTLGIGITGIATMLAGGAFKGINANGVLEIKGSGDALNAMLGAVLSVLLIKFLTPRLGSLKVVLLPTLSVIAVGLVSRLTIVPTSAVTNFIGSLVASFTELQPVLMSILLAMSFAFLTISPLSSVAVALLIGLSGNGSAAANIGITALSITLGILSYQANGIGTSIALLIGTNKIQMVNLLKYPIMVLPGLVSGAICSLVVPAFNLTGTPTSAGFGISGLIGPMGHLSTFGYSSTNWLIVTISWVIIPFIVSFISVKIFRDVLKLVKTDYYKLSV